ncbi:hypothetical protein BKA66DRAFT_438817 [Pyrenochaeta sp. MPI-SDFR-AT-0127]|nr:hypothetical protein BKA66DRAFT_438817 [Pyrenochaeta sp. MPI-SDFR-AT-0127]
MGIIQSRIYATEPQAPYMPPISALTSIEIVNELRSPPVTGVQVLSTRIEISTRLQQIDLSHFRFLHLPLEVRNMVYERLVVVGKVFYSPDHYDITNGQRCHDYKRFRKPELQLLRVCSQFHVEAESLYHAKNLFVLPIEWQQCYPFNTVSRVWCRKPNLGRQLFSAAGLDNIRHVSVAVDQKLTRLLGQTFENWQIREVHSNISYSQRTVQDRYRLAHDIHLENIFWEWSTMLRQLSSFQEGLLYLELDLTNAFCAIGDCRPFGSYSLAGWIKEVKPKALDVLGMQTMGEKQDFLARTMEAGIKHHNLRYQYGLRFRKLGDNKRWNIWKMDAEVKGEQSILPGDY